MTTSTVYYLHGINTGSTFLSQVTEAATATNLADLLEFASGQTGPQFSGSSFAGQDVSFTTRECAALLALLTTANCAAALNGGNVDVYYKAGTPFGTRVADATTSHLRMRMASNSLLYINGLRASQGGTAEASARIVPVSVGGAAPLVPAGSLALAGTSAVNHVYTMGPVKVNGTTLAAVQDIDVQWNVVPDIVADSGDPYFSYVGIASQSPTVTFRTRDTGIIATYAQTGAALSALVVYFRKRSTSGINVADGTAEHIALTASAGTLRVRQVSGMTGVVECQATLIKPNATTDPLTISTTSAIT